VQTQRIFTHASREHSASRAQEGIVVWDQQGVVVVWPDGHSTRLSWATIRQACQCAECREQRENHTLHMVMHS
jgi:DUF971 family protein